MTASPRTVRAALAASLVAATALTFARVVSLPFVSFDDPEYFTQNLALREGLTLASLRWALTTGHAANWHPITWISHAADIDLFGLQPAGPHAVNLALHCGSALLLYLLALRLTGAPWRSALLAGLFALHPLRVESVAWVSERKDVLAAFFWLATTLAWVRHLEAPAPRRLAAALGLFALALASKPMAVTLPFTLLLLDGWPLRRFDPAQPGRSARALVREKLPFFLLSAGASAATFLVQRSWGAMRPLAGIPLEDRAANALLAVLRYVGMWLWPADLAIFYPYPPERPSMVLLAAAAAVLLVATGLSWRLRGRHPHLLVGWLWFVGTLVPVIGLVQVGNQALADRYTYVPSIGLGLMLAWSLPEIAGRGLAVRRAAALGGVAVLALLAGLSARQIGFWRDDATLFGHALQVTGRNWLAQQVLGHEAERRGDLREAALRYQEALRDRPDAPEALNNLGNLLVATGDPQRGIALLRDAVRRWPGHVSALSNLGVALCEQRRPAEGVPLLQEAVRLAPERADLRFNLGLALGDAGRPAEALRELEVALRLAPGDAAVRTEVQRLRALGVR